jgi:hypothetical protein
MAGSKQRKTKRGFAMANLVIFTVLLATFGTLFFTMPKQGVSLVEKRNLAGVPKFSWDSLFFGLYIDSLDLYVADNFPYRERLVATSFKLEEWRGFRSAKIGFIETKVGVEEQIPVGVDTALLAGHDSLTFDTAGSGDKAGAGLIIYNGRCMELFGGNNALAKSYATTINKFQEALAGKATIYVAAVPSSIAFNAPDEYGRMALSEKANIDAVYANLAPGIRKVDAYSEIAAHRNEYVYFGTDHHWTALGAYYAYVAFCKSASIAPIQLSAMEKKTKRRYFGSLYQQTLDSRLKENPDSVEYWKVPGKHVTVRFAGGAAQNKPVPASLYAEGAGGANSYGVFLGGDNPLMRVQTSVKNGRKVVIVKNSYGNPFAPYFTANYEEVWVLDYRYYNHSLIDLVNENGIQDVVFLNGVFSVNTTWHIKMIGKLLRSSGTTVENPADTVKQPADTVKLIHVDSLKNKP